MILYTKQEQAELDREIIKIDDIVIPKRFSETTVRKSKLDKKIDFFNKYKEPKEIMIINKKNMLLDGYTSYLILKSIGAYEVLVKRV